MPKIIFTDNVIYKQVDPKNTRHFTKGDIVEMPADHCQRWVSRQVADYYKEPAGAAKKTVEPAPPPQTPDPAEAPPPATATDQVEIPVDYEAAPMPKLRELATIISGKQEQYSRPAAVAIIKAELERRAAVKPE